MKKRRSGRGILLLFIVVLYISKFSLLPRSDEKKAVNPDSPGQYLSSQDVDGYNPLVQRSRRSIRLGDNPLHPSQTPSLAAGSYINETVVSISSISIFPDIRDKIISRITLHFHGSKYKDIILFS